MLYLRGFRSRVTVQGRGSSVFRADSSPDVRISSLRVAIVRFPTTASLVRRDGSPVRERTQPMDRSGREDGSGMDCAGMTQGSEVRMRRTGRTQPMSGRPGTWVTRRGVERQSIRRISAAPIRGVLVLRSPFAAVRTAARHRRCRLSCVRRVSGVQQSASQRQRVLNTAAWGGTHERPSESA